MAYHGENERDNPYDATARNRRNTEASWMAPEVIEREYEPRDWAPKPLKSNTPRDLIDLATEEDSELRYDIAVRNRVRGQMVAAGLTVRDSDMPDWEWHLNEKQKAQRKDWRQMAGPAPRRKRERN